MKLQLLCYGCGYKESLRNRELQECPRCKSTEITITRKSSVESSGGDTMVILQVIFGIIGIVLLISGIILISFDFGLSRPFVDIWFYKLYLDPLGLTLFVIGVILLSLVTGEAFCCD